MGLTRAARIILVGAPGVGKGTQTERLIRKYPQLSSISSGDLLRDNVRKKSPLGIKAEGIMKAGNLLPDTVMLRLITNELKVRGWMENVMPLTLNSSSIAVEQPEEDISADFETSGLTSDDPSASFILDGFPRTASQASQIDKNIDINWVVSLKTPPSIIIDRICNRWVHAPSGRVYNTTFSPPQVEGKDDVTGEPLSRRADDDPDTWKTRLQKFEETSLSLLEHYDKKGVLWSVNGNSSNEITPQLVKEFERRFS
ncbi:MAG: hypothetical protein M1814_005151 [Vezdaea aestivalis]|nr:MAG: hypothetical protein M1814_005151 [Vezdaea aestivalis]